MLAVAPMFIWDVVRNRRIHEAYLIWLAVALPFTGCGACPVGHAMVGGNRTSANGCVIALHGR